MQNFRNFKICQVNADSGRRGLVFSKLQWFVTVSRNSLVLIVTSVIAWVMIGVYGLEHSVYITGNVPQGLPKWDLPWRYGLNDTADQEGPFEMASDLKDGLAMLPLVSMIQIIAIARNFSCKCTNIGSLHRALI